MLPNTANIDDLVLEFEGVAQAKTQTFNIDASKNIIRGKVDEVESLKQAIYLLLSVEADQYIIYPYTYGMKTVDLIGKPVYYVAAVIPNRVKDTLLSDDRITDVTDFTFERNKNKLHVKFVVKTIYGDLDGETVVTY